MDLGARFKADIMADICRICVLLAHQKHCTLEGTVWCFYGIVPKGLLGRIEAVLTVAHVPMYYIPHTIHWISSTSYHVLYILYYIRIMRAAPKSVTPLVSSKVPGCGSRPRTVTMGQQRHSCSEGRGCRQGPNNLRIALNWVLFGGVEVGCVCVWVGVVLGSMMEGPRNSRSFGEYFCG